MSDSKQRWAVTQKIDTVRRTIVMDLCIVDSFGDLHPLEDRTTEMQDPRWLTMKQADFEEAAKMSMAEAREQWAASFA